jgi:glucose/arabinose dehydrogenase
MQSKRVNIQGIFVALALLIAACIFLISALSSATTLAGAPRSTAVPSITPIANYGYESLPPGVSEEILATGLNYPIAMTFDPQGRLFITEQGGSVRLFAGGTLQASPVITFSVRCCGESGLLGITVDPDFDSNHYIYVYHMCDENTGCSSVESHVARFTESNGVGLDPTTIFTATTVVGSHVGGNIHFGPDKKLYITIGEGVGGNNAQDVTIKPGKIHRINSDGTIPPDNPVFTQTGALPSLYAIGLRNTFDFTFDPLVPGRIFAGENGPECQSRDDEMNRIEGGYNYGWRGSSPCNGTWDPTYNTIPPLWYLSSPLALAPTGITVYTGYQIPDWHNQLLMSVFGTDGLMHFYLNDDRTALTAANLVRSMVAFPDLETGPDGALWYFSWIGGPPHTLRRLVGPGPTSTPYVVPTHTPTPLSIATNTATAVHTAEATNTPTHTSTPEATSTDTLTVPSSTSTALVTTATSTATTSMATSTPCTISFIDVPPDSTFYFWIRCLACRGIISGYLDGTFRPTNDITRGQIAKIVSNAAAFSEDPGPQIYEDVDGTNPFFVWINRLSMRGHMGGYLCGTVDTEPCIEPDNRPYFRPFNNATRGQLAKIVANAGNVGGTPTGQYYADVEEDNPFYIWIMRLTELGVMGGYPCGGEGEPCDQENRPYFRSYNNVTRGQASKIVANTFFPGCQSP